MQPSTLPPIFDLDSVNDGVLIRLGRQEGKQRERHDPDWEEEEHQGRRRDITELTSSLSLTDDQDTAANKTSEIKNSETAQQSEKKKSNRCKSCNKKVGLTGFQCRCGDLFCGKHRYPEEHSCTVNFKQIGREILIKQNPVIKADKLDKIL
ncbi:zinc finger A20 and AN1 domain-containing stress-associated protein 5-like [Senna tora]|uniref:Zinc finger A20 and AN1 domain-containing stress-associated protein 5-like n=1 Tax=Senna tora TaxID=362788 RepID=A0A834T153_9FABA|nr:zinc finger A20 and AN1 domain-containing stress-associated protein 5-like [Senna tora]